MCVWGGVGGLGGDLGECMGVRVLGHACVLPYAGICVCL